MDGLTHIMDRMNDISDSPAIGDLSGMLDSPTRLAERIDNNDPTQLVESFVRDARAAGNVAIGEEPTLTQALVGGLFIYFSHTLLGVHQYIDLSIHRNSRCDDVILSMVN